jgi:hypothetical protein
MIIDRVIPLELRKKISFHFTFVRMYMLGVEIACAKYKSFCHH